MVDQNTPPHDSSRNKRALEVARTKESAVLYKVVSKRSLELQRGEKIAIEPQPMTSGKLYLFQVGALLIVGRWVSGWIIQPDRWIKIGNVAVEVLGQVARFPL